MQSKIIRRKFLNFFKKKGHKIMPSYSLLPEDPTVLFTSAGMQQFLPYLCGEKDPIEDFGTRHLASCQKCFRTDDIEKVGNETHHTFFEMLGNWSIGEDPKTGYFKKEAIRYALEFFVDDLGLEKDRIWVTIFKGEGEIPRDEESLRLWQENGIKKEKIKEFGIKENFWGPVGRRGPCGPSSEIHYDRGEKFGCKSRDCGPNCKKCNRFFELWNLVFMEYYKNEDGTFKKLPQRNIDTGIGFERLVTVLQGKPSSYETDLFWPIYKEILNSSQVSEKKPPKRYLRILCDHIRASAFLISEGILPSNQEQGYILRRLLRRCIRYAQILRLKENWYVDTVKAIGKIYGKIYPEVKSSEEKIITVIQNEEEKFSRTLKSGLKQLHKIFNWWENHVVVSEKIPGGKIKVINPIESAKVLGKKLFFVYQSYGFPIELSFEEFDTFFGEQLSFKEISKEEFKKLSKEFEEEEFKKHQEISRKGAEKKFGGGGKLSPELHTATHLLHSALRKILGEQVKQMGSDITKERLRFDFSFPRKLTKEEINKIENLVNQKIKENLKVKEEEMPLREALLSGALAFFEEKYPPKVKVYTIFDPKKGEIFSKEICAGPHVKETGKLGKFKIQKEESVGIAKRRIKAVLL